MEKDVIRHIIERTAAASVFISFGVWEILQPSYWSVFIPSFLSSFHDALSLVMLHGLILLAIGLAVLVGFYLQYASALGALMMFAIILDLASVSGFSDILVRDIAILLIFLSLVFEEKRYFSLKG